jgi:hypothetical protein
MKFLCFILVRPGKGQKVFPLDGEHFFLNPLQLIIHQSSHLRSCIQVICENDVSSIKPRNIQVVLWYLCLIIFGLIMMIMIIIIIIINLRQFLKRIYISNLNKLVGSKVIFRGTEAHSHNYTTNLFCHITCEM